MTRTRHWAEDAARRWLERRGYRTLAANYRIRGGEIDLVMEDRRGARPVLVFVEVRQRSGRHAARFGPPLESLGPRKWRRLRRAALHYLAHHAADPLPPARFDAVLLTGGRTGWRLEHVEG